MILTWRMCVLSPLPMQYWGLRWPHLTSFLCGASRLDFEFLLTGACTTSSLWKSEAEACTLCVASRACACHWDGCLQRNCATLGLMCVYLLRFLSVNDPEALSLVLHLLNSLAKLEQNLLALLTEGSVTIVGDAIAALGAEPLVIRQCASFLESVAGKCKVGLVQGATAHSVVTLQCVRRPVGWPARPTKCASLCTACKRRSVMTRRSCDHASARWQLLKDKPGSQQGGRWQCARLDASQHIARLIEHHLVLVSGPGWLDTSMEVPGTSSPLNFNSMAVVSPLCQRPCKPTVRAVPEPAMIPGRLPASMLPVQH